ncbi:hypothetical protein IEO21_06436 [Rhodonia placenta]|uniref:GSKIP domain-containing protein n=2 Tax=Rhodonia placenta TaxID=104341 RepID=A0A1X6MUZ7_9APHY|nr:hypothetical protein POSPLADRAFT_1040866 [Postia placenta MAD-698-R-SB12]KAF9811780.1 hypothetical protein IEO21_06436 [Postia placenta]OSX60023.1 hypothetical protein POSPLADRAFT_1040866 [Postia placenta MAD-698-R-SB12]
MADGHRCGNPSDDSEQSSRTPVPSVDDLSRPSTPDFPTAELTNALEEQCFGIVNFTIVSSTVHEAFARVALLEGNTVIISLSPRGYTAGIGPGQEPREMPTESILELSYESIEDILTVLSSRYADARRDRLFAKLQALSP